MSAPVDEDELEFSERLPATKKERVIRMLPQLIARSPEWGRMPVDITKPVILAAAAESGVKIEVATRKRDGVTRVWARIPVPSTTPDQGAPNTEGQHHAAR